MLSLVEVANEGASGMNRYLGIAALLGICPAANAETLNIAGYYAAGADVERKVETIVVEDFVGDAGPELSFLLTDQLADIEIEGRGWFSIVPESLADRYLATRTSYSGLDSDGTAKGHNFFPTVAALQGSVHTQINEYDTDAKEVEKCVKKVDGDCVKRETVTYECRVFSVGYSPSVRLTASDGTVLYRDSRYLDADQTYCMDEADTPDPYEMLESLAQSYSYAVRLDLAPHYRDEDIRILERRKGMSKPDAKRFKEAVRLTKTDPNAACLAFGELEADNQQHLSVLFNIGLCHESAGDLHASLDYYTRALEVSPKKHQAKAGLSRVISRIDAERQIVDHLSST